MPARHLHEVEWHVVLEQHLGERPGIADQAVLGPRVQVDVREFFVRNFEDELEGVVSVGTLRGGRRSSRLAAC